MRGIICYYSGSGNTKLAVDRIVRGIPSVRFHLVDIRSGTVPDFATADLAGFATFTDFWGVPKLMEDFLGKIPEKTIPAFLLNTFGMMSGRTLLRMERLVRARRFQVCAGFSLHTPESYPPMIARGMGNEQAPNQGELDQFDRFITDLNARIERRTAGGPIGKKIIQAGFLAHILPAMSRTKARRDMGEKSIDESLCTKCGTCMRGCPYRAIHLAPFPVFDMEKCYGCWSCYNHCPNLAVYTKKYRGRCHYPAPITVLADKLAR